jgi:hypothetical protein
MHVDLCLKNQRKITEHRKSTREKCAKKVLKKRSGKIREQKFSKNF